MNNHHVTTMKCVECERLKLGILIARRERPSDVPRWEMRLRVHLGGRLAEDNPQLFATLRQDAEARR